jgi:hypothetical protein
MQRALFPGDKNFILKEVQASVREDLLKELVDFVKAYYLLKHNPLGLVDETISSVQNSDHFPSEPFDEFYHDLAALYRYQFGEIQLEFLFDGRTHFEKYSQEWENFFKENITEFCANRFFIRAVLDIAVFHNHDRVAELAGDRLKYFLIQHYEVKVYKYRGLRKLKVS